MKKITGISLFIFFCVVTAILTAGLVFYQNTKINNTKFNDATIGSTTTPIGIKVTEVVKHSSPSDCWMIINNKVYNLSNYDVQHPGGADQIDSYCGKDATTAYDTKGRPGGSPHSSYADSLLSQFYVGDLTK